MNSSWWLAAIGLLLYARWAIYTQEVHFLFPTLHLGNLLQVLLMGMGIVLISFFIQTGTVTIESILIATPIMILVGAINLSNNIRDLDGDKEHGRKTLPSCLVKKMLLTF